MATPNRPITKETTEEDRLRTLQHRIISLFGLGIGVGAIFPITAVLVAMLHSGDRDILSNGDYFLWFTGIIFAVLITDYSLLILTVFFYVNRKYHILFNLFLYLTGVMNLVALHLMVYMTGRAIVSMFSIYYLYAPLIVSVAFPAKERELSDGESRSAMRIFLVGRFNAIVRWPIVNFLVGRLDAIVRWPIVSFLVRWLIVNFLVRVFNFLRDGWPRLVTSLAVLVSFALNLFDSCKLRYSLPIDPCQLPYFLPTLDWKQVEVVADADLNRIFLVGFTSLVVSSYLMTTYTNRRGPLVRPGTETTNSAPNAVGDPRHAPANSNPGDPES